MSLIDSGDQARRAQEKRALLAQLLQQRAARPRSYPTSFAQQRLWVLWQLDPESPVYNIPCAIRLRGQFDLSALRRSLQTLLRRHDILRTTFPIVDDEPVQQVAPDADVTLPVVNLAMLPAQEREAEILRLANVEARRPFDLTSGPLLRLLLMQLAEDDHVLLLTMHHIITDGWSINILMSELTQLYEAFRLGAPSPLPPLTLQYADYAIWQRQWLQQDTVQTQVEYWIKQLASAPSLLALPTDRQRPATQTFSGAQEPIELTPELTSALRALSQRNGVTLFMLLLAAFKTLLYRYTSQIDIVVGTPIANRHRVEIEALIGFFVNMLALRTDLSGDPSFADLLRRVRRVALEGFARQDVPFEWLVKQLAPERDLSHTPLFQVVFAFEAHNELVSTPDSASILVGIDTGTTKYDLTLSLTETKEVIAGVCQYRTDLFDAATIRRMVGHYVTLLQGIVAAPEQSISRLPLLTAQERRTLVTDWNASAAPFPEATCFHHLIEAQVERTPDAIALTYGAATVRYRELNERANQLAHYLRTIGVRPGSVVGLCLPRSFEMVIGMLAILKAGAAFMPLDPANPAERLRFMIEDARPALLLTQADLAERLFGPASDLAQIQEHGRYLALDALWPVIAQERSSNPPGLAMPESLAYIIYTSGSTGRPKGALLHHRGLCNLSNTQWRAFRVGPGSRVLQFASFSFDAAISEIAMALCSGATLCLADQETLSTIPDLLRLLRDERITTITLPPSLLASLPPDDLPSLETVIAAGERCTKEIVDRWQTLVDGRARRFFNGYGPTEATICASMSLCAATDTLAPSIGQPLPNVRLYVLDRLGEPVPIGVPGELSIGGIGVGYGYLNRPDLTAETFIPDPFSDQPGARLYKTGDLVRYRADGMLEFLGRIDYQVKLRGFRVELGEIEAVLSQHPDVQEAVVIARSDRSDQPRLVGYVVPQRAADAELAERLRRFLHERLPVYMVPGVIMQLDAFPLTSNGKVDRNALPTPERGTVETRVAFVAPRTEAETLLAEIWAQVLGLDRVGIHDNFFDLGGDSILSFRIVSRANQAGLRFNARAIFQHPTIAELVQLAESAPAIQAEQGLVSGDVPLTPIQRWFFEQSAPETLTFSQATLLELRQPVDLLRLEQALHALIEHHDALRLRFEQTTEWRQFHSDPGTVMRFQRVDLSQLQPSARSQTIAATIAEEQDRLTLAAGQLLRVTFFDPGQNSSAHLFIGIHHLIVDAFSWQVVLEDLDAAYQQARRGASIQLPAKTTSFKDWSERLTRYAQSPEIQAEYGYWHTPARTVRYPLPLDYQPVTQANDDLTATVTVTLEAEQTRRLLQDAPKAYHAQTSDLLLTALAQTLTDWMGCPAVLVDLEGHGREDLFPDNDLSRTVGWFTSLYPVLLDLGQAHRLEDALIAIKEQLRAVPRRGVGYGLLRYLSSDATLRNQLQALPQAEVSFNYLGQLDQTLSVRNTFQISSELGAEARGRPGRERHLLAINSYIAGGELSVTWTYHPDRHRHATIHQVAETFIARLTELIAHCLDPEAGGYTASDFPLAGLNQRQLEQLSDLIDMDE